MADQGQFDPAAAHAFLSYTRFDDKVLSGGISALREALELAVQARTGKPFNIFQDVEDISPGDAWRKKLDRAIEAAQLFIPILTPSFFESDFCKSEARAFLDYEARAGRDDLVLPIYLIDTPKLDDAGQRAADEIASRLHERQYADWRPLRFKLQHQDTLPNIDELAKAIASAIAKNGRAVMPPEPPPSDLADRLTVLEAKLEERDRAIKAERSRRERLEAELASEKAKARELAEAPSDFRGKIEEATKQRETERGATGMSRAFYLGGAALALLFGAGGWMLGQGGSSSSDVELLRLQNQDLVQELDVRAAELDEARSEMASQQASGDEVAKLAEQVEALSAQLADSEQALAIAKENEQRALENALAELKAAPAEQENTHGAGDTFKDCDHCPEMVVIPAGSFLMGSPDGEGHADERPQHEVTIAEPFALGKYEVTFDEWDACVAAGGCDHEPGDEGWGRGALPVINVSWEDAKQYVAWLSQETGEVYRLPSEAEWEYAARAFPASKGPTAPAYAFGDSITEEQANFGGNIGRTTEVGRYPPNDWGMHDMHGNVWEWVEDSWHDDYNGAPADGSAWNTGNNPMRVIRGGAWDNYSRNLRSADRFGDEPFIRFSNLGFRVSRTLTP